MKRIESSALTGLIAATHTPMHSDRSLHTEMVPQQARHLAHAGVTGVFVCGSTGESHSLTLEERLRIARSWKEPAREHGLQLVMQVGDNCLEVACKLAREAGELGAAAISAMPPSYFKPSTVDDLVDYCRIVAAEAPEVPFYYYDIPGMSGVKLSMVEFLRRGHHQIPTLRGIKYSNPDLVQLQACLHLDAGDFDILFGSDELLLAALALGVRGAVGSTYNYAAPLYLSMIQAYQRGEMERARALQYDSVRMVECQVPRGVIASGKAIMSWLGLDCGPVRLPLKEPSPDQMSGLREELKRIESLREVLFDLEDPQS